MNPWAAASGAVVLTLAIALPTSSGAAPTAWTPDEPGITSAGSSDWTFAWSLGLNQDGSLLAVGDPDDNVAYVYPGTPGQWGEPIRIAPDDNQPCGTLLEGFGEGVQFDADDDLLVSSEECGIWAVEPFMGPAVYSIANGAAADAFYGLTMLDDASPAGSMTNDGTLISSPACNVSFNGTEWICTPAVALTYGPEGSIMTAGTGSIVNVPSSCYATQDVAFIGGANLLAVCSNSPNWNTGNQSGGAVYVSRPTNAPGTSQYSAFGTPLTYSWGYITGWIPNTFPPVTAAGGSTLAIGDGDSATVQVSTWTGSAWSTGTTVTLNPSDSCLGSGVDVSASGTIVVATDPCSNAITVLSFVNGAWQQTTLEAPSWVDYVVGQVAVSGDGSTIAYSAVPASNTSLVAVGAFVVSSTAAASSGSGWQASAEPRVTPAVAPAATTAKPATFRALGTVGARAVKRGIVVSLTPAEHRSSSLRMRVRGGDGEFLDEAYLHVSRKAKGTPRTAVWGGKKGLRPSVISKPGASRIEVLLPVPAPGDYEVAVWGQTQQVHRQGGIEIGVGPRHWNSGPLRVK